jgi:hypothetical protein
MTNSVRIHRLAGVTIYKVLFLGTAFSLGVFGVLMGIFAAFGASTVSWNGAHVYGLWGLGAGILLGVLCVLFVTLFIGTACIFGTWLYSKFGTMEITYVPGQSAGPP